jgi:hypothetical protein
MLSEMLLQAHTPSELRPYQDQLMTKCNELRTAVDLNLRYLSLDRREIVNNILTFTQQATQWVRLLSSRLSIPVLRANSSDRLCLTTISWLHRAHSETAAYAPAFASGNCAVWPFQGIAPIYYFPIIEQHSLLYQPLLFHEFGHFLYRCHEPEMNDLVRDLQIAIDDILIPASQRNDRYSDIMTSQRQEIAYTWYRWIQELFCDAVGFTIGGPSFLHAFSRFFGIRDQGDFYRQPNALKFTTHPVTWLRVNFLAIRVEASGFRDLSRRIEREWRTVAESMGVHEDYHGFYDESLKRVVLNTIEDMVIEAGPRQFQEAEAKGKECLPDNSLVHLLNQAWQVYTADPANYPMWEDRQVSQLLNETCVPRITV